MYDELIKNLRICSRCDFGQNCNGCTQDRDDRFCCDILLSEAADTIEELQDALLLMVLQYCTTDDGVLYNSFMSAGEDAFAALGVKNGQQAFQLWDKMSNRKLPKEE